ncbi:family 4 glycosyl hydrolase [Roseobacter weihaiensis]|uniref:family 4 glycosyl hydrolase n=1 Tax=Roseobacter weihaiensis TaxID=2763262 RepID=UPI001D0B2BD6|nr:hypothetical protein [Roseobacter sp. H9]
MQKITVVGGSSPFTVSLIDAIAQDEALVGALYDCHLVLNGRNTSNLNAVSDYAATLLGDRLASIQPSTDLDASLDGADIVLLQARFGGLAARAEDEAFAARMGSVPDETLGPGGLLSAFRQWGAVEDLSRRMIALCPNAFVINLVNPLSLVTSQMIENGLNAIGICELPFATVRLLAESQGADPYTTQWDYEGLNHRGFITRAGTSEGVDLLQEARRSDTIDKALYEGAGEFLDTFGVLPTKYFSIFHYRRPLKAGRAEMLNSLRSDIAHALATNPDKRPNRLAERDTSWYPDAVVPVLAGRLSVRPYSWTVNTVAREGLVSEQRVALFGESMTVMTTAPVQGPARDWLNYYETQERLSMTALKRRTFDSILQALSFDRLTPTETLHDAATEIHEAWAAAYPQASTTPVNTNRSME